MVISGKYKNPLFISVFLCVIIIYGNMTKIPVKKKFTSCIKENDVKVLEGMLISSPVKNGSGKYYSSKLKVQTSGNQTGITSVSSGDVIVFIPSEKIEAFFPGRLYSLSKANDLFESGSNVSLTGKFSKGQFFATDAVSYGFEDNFFSRIKKIRALGRLQFKRLLYKWGSGGGLLLALITGAREYTESDVSEKFRKAGLSHILALSGMHLSLFSSLALFMGNLVKRKKLSLILQLTAVIIFVWFAGFSPSLMRAFICVAVLLFQMIINIEKTDMLLVLCFSFFVQTIINPEDLLNAGFILSYGALCGILISGEFFRKVFSFILPKYFAGSLSASISAQAFTMPLSAILFGQVTPIGVISAVIVSPVVSIFIYTGLALLVIGLVFPFTADLSGIFIQMQYNLIKYLVGLFSRIPPITF